MLIHSVRWRPPPSGEIRQKTVRIVKATNPQQTTEEQGGCFVYAAEPIDDDCDDLYSDCAISMMMVMVSR